MSFKIIDLVLKCSLPALKTDKGRLVTGPVAKLVLISLASHADGSGRQAYPSANRLCLETGYSLPTVIGALNALRTNGYIQLSGRSKWRTMNYTILVERLETLNPVEPQDSSGFSSDTKPALENPSLNQPLKTLVVVKDGEAEIFGAYESEIGPLTPIIREAIHAWLREDVPRGWISEAITLAVRNNARRWSYVEAILRSWKTHGKGTGKESKHAAHPKNACKPEQAARRKPSPREPDPEDLALAGVINDLRRLRRMGPPPGQAG